MSGTRGGEEGFFEAAFVEGYSRVAVLNRQESWVFEVSGAVSGRPVQCGATYSS